jgi:uncharacterized protein DUF3987
MTPVPIELLQQLAARLPSSDTPNSGHQIAGSFDLESWIRNRGLDVDGPSQWQGGLRWVFRVCPFNQEHRNRSAYIVLLSDGAIAAGCHHNGCRGRDWHTLRDLVDPGWRENLDEVGTAPGNTDHRLWQAPFPFDQFNLPRFPSQSLPQLLRAFVEALATATQTPVDLAGMLVLSIVAASSAKKVVVGLKEGWGEPVNIFTATALPPGSRKSAVFAAVVSPLAEFERQESRRAGTEIEKGRSTRRIKEARLKKIEERAVTAKATELGAIMSEAQRLAAELAETNIGSPPRMLADDCTPETLSTLLREQDGRIAVMSPEGDVFDLLSGRYSVHGVGNFGVFLKGHAGDTLRVDRVGRSEYVKQPALTVGLAVQPEVIRGLAQKRGFRGRGLLGRFLYALPFNLLGRRNTNPPPVPDDVRIAYHACVISLLNIPIRKDSAGDADSRVLILDPEARASFQRFEEWIEPQLSEFGELGGITDWGGKLAGAVGRIAGILHMAACIGEGALWETPIPRETMENAIRLGKYFIPHAKAAFAQMGADKVVEHAKHVLRWIEHTKTDSFSRRDLHQALKGTFKHANELEPPLAVLVAHGFIRGRSETSNAGRGRPPSLVYEVNPLWVPQNAQDTQTTTNDSNSEDFEDSEEPFSDCSEGDASRT